MLKQVREAVVRGVLPVDIHGQRYVQVTYAHVDAPDKPVQARVGLESVYPELTEGDRVAVHYMMNVVTRIAPTGAPHE